MSERRIELACCCATRSVGPRKDLWTHESAPPPPRRESDDEATSGRASRGRDASAGRLEHAAGGGSTKVVGAERPAPRHGGGWATAYEVLNVNSSPLPLPAGLVAEIRKWYSVFATRPAAIDANTATGLDPDPGSVVHGTLDP